MSQDRVELDSTHDRRRLKNYNKKKKKKKKKKMKQQTEKQTRKTQPQRP